jgi:hypothetical protein
MRYNKFVYYIDLGPKKSEALGTHHLQATVTMATAEKRFHIPSEEEIDKLLTDKDSINTQKATKLSVKCFRVPIVQSN